MQYVFTSTWSHDGDEGEIRQFSMDEATGELTYIRTLEQSHSFGVLIVDQERNILYALNETTESPDMRNGGGGSIIEFPLDPESAMPAPGRRIPTFCPSPSYAAVSADGKYLVVSNHSGSNFATKIARDADGNFFADIVYDDSAVELFELDGDGKIGRMIDVSLHDGTGPGRRQANAHPHCAVMSPSGRLFAVCDKGSDEVWFYEIKDGKLKCCQEPFKVPAGTMPRYCVFHKSLPYFYHNNEGSAYISAYKYNEDGQLEFIRNYSAIAGEDQGENAAGEQQGMCMHPSGRFIYDIVKSQDMVAVFSTDSEGAGLTLIQNIKISHSWPRSVNCSPDGKYLIVTCLKGGKIIVLKINEDGSLSETGYEYDQKSCADAAFWTV